MIKLRFPDFIIAGAPRSGTTWLYHLLDRHPEINVAKPLNPEPKFFLVDELYCKGLEYYARTWFFNVPDGKICGEKSTNYMEDARVADRIHKHLPNLKLIFILREPADRAFSNYFWSRMNGLEHEDFETALALEVQREKELPERFRYSRPHAYFSRGLYANMLLPYFKLFHRDQIICLKYEDIIEKSKTLAAKLHDFLGVHQYPESAEGLGLINPSNKEGHVFPSAVRKKLLDAYAGPNRRLSKLLGAEFLIWET